MKNLKKFLSFVLAGLMVLSAPLACMAEGFAPTIDYAFRDHNTPVDQRIDEILSLMTLEEKMAMSSGGAAVNRLGLNNARGGGGEGLHGVDDRGIASVFPSSLGLSQSWDMDLMYEFGAVVAEESLADNGSTERLTPVLDILRDPRYGRAYETYGEDGFLTGMLGTAATGGMNQRNEDGYFQFIPILKHPMPYNTEINRLWTNIVMRPRTYYEYYMRAFKYPISAGNAKSLMNTYQMVNGKPFSVNPIQDELLNEWTPDYEGTGHYEYKTVNDYGSGSSMFVHSQRYFSDDPLGRAFGVAQGAQNGQMSWSFRSYGSGNGGSHGGASGPLYDALARGLLTEEDLEENARRALSLNLRKGDLDQLEIQSEYIVPGGKTSQDRLEVVKENRDVVFTASQEQIVLLKNDGILPLSGADTDDVVLLGPLADQILNDHYTGARLYSVTLKDALQNKLGKENVAFDRAIDTVAIKAPNGQFLVSANNPIYRSAGSSTADDQPILANGAVETVTIDDVAMLFEIYDYGSTYNLLRTPINNQYVQVTPFAIANSWWSQNAYSVTAINNTSAPGEANKLTGETAYVNYQTFRIVPTTDGKWGFYNLIAGNGSNGGVGKAYDADDEDTNNGSYIMLSEDGTLVADLSTIGPYRNELHDADADVLESKVDTDPTDKAIDGLREESKFDIVPVRTSAQAIDETLAAADADAPIILVVGYEPHLNAREAIDLYQPGLSAQQMGMIDYLTGDLGRDIILIVKTGSPMTINEEVAKNDKIKAILEIGHTSQEEGSALVSVLFDDGYSVPKVGFEPAYPDHNIGDTPEAFAEYPGYLADVEAGTIPAASPAGRLTATWYKEITDMIGSSTDHAPASYAWPAFNEETNDNLSNINGTINTGIMIYDIIKGERTYQYFNGEPLYAFGYGLTYTDFEYADVKASDVKDGFITISGTVKNVGEYASDEVVQVYSSFIGDASRIKQANQRLIAFDRLQDIQPGEARAFSFDIDVKDTIGVFDVEAQEIIVEAGDYVIRAVPSSGVAAADNNSVIVALEGKAPALRDLTSVKIASDYDDYSMIGAQLDDIEAVSASVAYDSNTVIQFRKDGAWILFEDAKFDEAQKVFTAQVGSDREGTLKVFALPAGADSAELANAAPVAIINLEDTRAVEGLPTGLGIGPVGVNPGTPKGQEYKDAYVKPEWTKVCVDASLEAGLYDIYIQAEKRGARLDWFKFGVAADEANAIGISQLYKIDSIRTMGGELALTADLDPISAMDDVTWSVTAIDGSATDLATISESGVLKATAKANGTVLVTAKAGELSAAIEVLITNQLEENKVDVAGAKKTAEYVFLTTGGRLGQNDNIMRYKGTNQQTLVFSELFSENADSYYAPGVFLQISADQVDWKVTDLDGQPTELAAIDENGLLTALGVDDGKVLVTATVKNNPDLVAERVIWLQNQAAKDAFTMIQAEYYDLGEGYAAPTAVTTFGKNGNEMGLAVNLDFANDATAMSLLYNKVDFGEGAKELYLRLSSADKAIGIKVFVDGELVAELTDAGTGDIVTFETVKATFDAISGVHDLSFEFTGGAARLNWFQFL